MTTINQEEIQKFSKIADEWWDANGKFKPLHRFNPIRIKYIIDKCTYHFNLKNNNDKLYGLKFLDIGCGGGLVSEPLCRLGGNVTGIDASSKNIEVAKIHARKNKLKIKYLNTSPEKKQIKDKFDVILNLEVIKSDVENGLIYIFKPSVLKNYKNRFGGRGYVCSKHWSKILMVRNDTNSPAELTAKNKLAKEANKSKGILPGYNGNE